MIILLFIIILFVVCFLIPLNAGKFDKQTETTVTIDPDIDEINIATLEEKRVNLENAIIKYNRLLDILEREYQNETSDKKKMIILKNQAATLEKLNRTIEKLEKLG